MTDGAGNATPLSMSSSTLQVSAANIELVESTGGNNVSTLTPAKINFEGTVDFTYASVTGIGGGTPGLADGTGTNSIVSTLTDLPGSSTGFSSLAVGRNAQSTNDSSVAVGNYATASGAKAVSIGSEVTASATTSL